MGLPEPEIKQTSVCEPLPRPRQPLTRGQRVLLLGIGLLLGGMFAIRHGQYMSTSAENPLPSPQSLLGSLAGNSDEEKILFSATTAEPARPADLLSAGLPMIYVFYRIPGVTANDLLRAQWSKNGVAHGDIPSGSITEDRRAGTGTIAMRAPKGGFSPGVYEVELKQGPNKITGSFVTAWGAEAIVAQEAPKDSEVAIPKVAFADAVGAQGQPQHAREAFYGTDRVYFAFRYTQAEPGSTVKVSWYGGDVAIESAEREVLLPSAEGWAHAWLQAPFPGLPPGEYRATVTMSADTRPIVTGSFTVAEGPAPITPPVP